MGGGGGGEVGEVKGRETNLQVTGSHGSQYPRSNRQIGKGGWSGW